MRHRMLIAASLVVCALASRGASATTTSNAPAVSDGQEQGDREGRPAGSTPAPSGVDARIHRFAMRWMQLREPQRRRIARSLLPYVDRATGESGADAGSVAFVRAMLESMSVRERNRLLGGGPPQRLRRLVRLIHRYAGHVRLVGRIPADLRKMVAAKKATARERDAILAIADTRVRVKAFLRLRETVLLRELLADGRIDDATFRRVANLPAGVRRARALAGLRRDVFLRVNRHLLHLFLSAEERERLAESMRLHQEIRQLERKHRIRFLRIMPSTKESDFSRCLRLTSEEERALAAAAESERPTVVKAIYARQRAALIAMLESADAPRMRFILSRIRNVESPHEFYRRAARLSAR